jgi:hypothetical protein
MFSQTQIRISSSRACTQAHVERAHPRAIEGLSTRHIFASLFPDDYMCPGLNANSLAHTSRLHDRQLKTNEGGHNHMY